MTYNSKRIRIGTETYIRLIRRKKIPKEPMDSVINRILDGDIDEQPR